MAEAISQFHQGRSYSDMNFTEGKYQNDHTLTHSQLIKFADGRLELSYRNIDSARGQELPMRTPRQDADVVDPAPSSSAALPTSSSASLCNDPDAEFLMLQFDVDLNNFRREVSPLLLPEKKDGGRVARSATTYSATLKVIVYVKARHLGQSKDGSYLFYQNSKFRYSLFLG